MGVRVQVSFGLQKNIEDNVIETTMRVEKLFLNVNIPYDSEKNQGQNSMVINIFYIGH